MKAVHKKGVLKAHKKNKKKEGIKLVTSSRVFLRGVPSPSFGFELPAAPFSSNAVSSKFFNKNQKSL
jgi:hypothetical protein